MLANICLRILKHAILDLIFTFPDAILIVDRDLVLQFDYYYVWIKKKRAKSRKSAYDIFAQIWQQ